MFRAFIRRSSFVALVVALAFAGSLAADAQPVFDRSSVDTMIAWLTGWWPGSASVVAAPAQAQEKSLPRPTERGVRPKKRDGIDIVPDGKR